MNLQKHNDPIALEEEDKFYDYLSLGIYNIMFTSDPDVIILGGGVTQHKELVENIEKRIDARLKRSNLESYQYEITTCKYLNDANLVGAVYAYTLQHGGN